jgi:hypothetical protein
VPEALRHGRCNSDATFASPTRLVARLLYGSIRGVTHLVGASIDLVLAQLAPLLGEGAPAPEREALLAVLKGVTDMRFGSVLEFDFVQA